MSDRLLGIVPLPPGAYLRQMAYTSRECPGTPRKYMIDSKQTYRSARMAEAFAGVEPRAALTAGRSLGYLTPNEFENLHSPQPQATLS